MTRGMEYAEDPDYDAMRTMFNELAQKKNRYVWESIPEYKEIRRKFQAGEGDESRIFTESSVNNQSS